jgi:response regulator RpfG family c-di-GMP phosphodiesterase
MVRMTSNPLLSVLIVDDEMELALIYKKYLELSGYDVVSFTDPLLAFEYYKENIQRFTHVLTDLRMPTINGIELASKIRKLNNKVRIFLITAFTIDDFINNKDYVDSKIEMVIEKPVRLNTLREYLNIDYSEKSN